MNSFILLSFSVGNTEYKNIFSCFEGKSEHIE